MGKRSNFEKIDKDLYQTPKEAVIPLLPFLLPGTRFSEPCYGKGALAYWLTTGPGDLKLEHASELQSWKELGLEYPKDYDHSQGIQFEKNALTLSEEDVKNCDYIVTNPPWTRTKKNPILHLMINHFRKLRPTWLLFDADWMHTKQAKDYLPYCLIIVSVGRVKWIPDSKSTGKDNCCWYLFDKDVASDTLFYGR